jgi:hypothetical protein
MQATRPTLFSTPGLRSTAQTLWQWHGKRERRAVGGTWYTRVLPPGVGVTSCFFRMSSSCCLRASTCGSRGLLPLRSSAPTLAQLYAAGAQLRVVHICSGPALSHPNSSQHVTAWHVTATCSHLDHMKCRPVLPCKS